MKQTFWILGIIGVIIILLIIFRKKFFKEEEKPEIALRRASISPPDAIFYIDMSIPYSTECDLLYGKGKGRYKLHDGCCYEFYDKVIIKNIPYCRYKKIHCKLDTTKSPPECIYP